MPTLPHRTKSLIVLAVAALVLHAACGTEESTPDPDSGGETTPQPDGEVGPPTITQAAAGQGQTALVETAVEIAPQILVTDADGDPVPGVSVVFRVDGGGGTIEGAEQTTGPNGLAAITSWTLGPVPGENILVAEVAGLAPVTFLATGVADARGSMTISAGDGQFGRAGESLPVPPAVVVLDSDGAAVSGRTVSFEVATGGGSIIGESSVTTGDDGVAAIEGWTLGDQPGEQTLTATTDDLPQLTFRATAVSTQEPVLERTVWLDGMNRPWDLAFLPDGAALVTERGGRVLYVAPGSDEPQLVVEPSDVNAQTQSGMLGIAVDPDFDTNRFFYTFMSSNRDGSMDNRVRQWRLNEGGAGAEEIGDILVGIPWGSRGGHSGGRLRFGPDGYLYATTGDIRAATVPQDLDGPTALGGKVIRITTDGQPAPGNPDLGATAPDVIFAYGFRNPQGIAFQPGTGEVFLCEHGPNEDDEISRIRAGDNGGWNPNDGQGNYNGYDGAIMTDTSQFPDAVLPAAVVNNSAGMAGCTFLEGPGWGSWQGRLVVGFLAGRRLLVVEPSADALAPPRSTESIFDGTARLRSVVEGPDGALYVTVDADAPGGQIWRVTPTL
jgi:glucose/arabinose dehydrogenase